jgi:hypothetical protein
MQTISTTKERFKPLLILLKIYVVVAPLILVALIRGVGLDGDVAVHLLTAGYAVTVCVLLFAGIYQLSAGLRKSAYSSFIFVGISLLWILVLVFVLPSLSLAG